MAIEQRILRLRPHHVEKQLYKSIVDIIIDKNTTGVN